MSTEIALRIVIHPAEFWAEFPELTVIPAGQTGVAIYWATPDPVPTHDDPLGVKWEGQFFDFNSPALRGVDRDDDRALALRAYIAAAGLHPIMSQMGMMAEVRR